MRILVFEPLKEPYVKDIEDDIHAMQEVVGGSIEPIYFEPKQDAICCVSCNKGRTFAKSIDLWAAI